MCSLTSAPPFNGCSFAGATVQAGCLRSQGRNVFVMNDYDEKPPLPPKGWYSRGYLPHYDGGSTTQFITFRLADSLPQWILDKLKLQLESGEIVDSDFRRRIEYYLDQGLGSCVLRDARIAEIIRENLLRFDCTKYRLHAWVIMPNHVHLLLTPGENHALAEILHSCKSYTALQANRILERRGQFWLRESFDRFVRNREHFENAFSYIENNPVKAKLCEKSSDWRFDSANLKSN